jgi:hypothetical protein
MHKGWVAILNLRITRYLLRNMCTSMSDELEAKNHIPNHWAFCPGEMEFKPQNEMKKGTLGFKGHITS